MAWSDPSPRNRGRVAAAGPGDGAPEVRLSFGTILARGLMTVVAGACVYAGVRAAMHAWLPGRGAVLDVALPLGVAAFTGWLLLRFLLRQPATVRRDWGSGYDNTSFGQAAAVEATVDIIDAALD